MRATLLGLLIFGTAACADKENTLEGDWFLCTNDDGCTLFDDEGLRFANGTLFELEGAAGVHDRIDSYCSEASIGLYTLEGDQLTLTDTRGSETIDVVFDEDTFSVTISGEQRRYRRVDPARSTGECTGNANAPQIRSFFAAPQRIDAGSMTSLRWVVEKATAIMISQTGADNPIIHSTQLETGAITVGPLSIDTTFELFAASGDGVATERLIVEVETEQRVVFEHAGFVDRMAVDGEHVYFTQPELRSMSRMELDGANVEVLASDIDPVALALHGDTVYFLERFGQVRSVPKNGGAITALATVSTAEGAGRSELQIHGDYLYARPQRAQIERLRLDGAGGVERVANPEAPGGDFTFAGDRLIYFTVKVFDHLLLSAEPDGTDTTTIAIHRDMAVDGALEADTREIFYLVSPATNIDETRVRATALDGITRDLVFTGNQPRHMAIDAENVYWSSEGFTDRITSIPKVGGAEQMIALVNNDFYVTELIAGETHLFWSEWGSAGARIQSVPK